MPSTSSSSLTDILVGLITSPDTLTDDWATIGERAFVDTVGVTLAGSGEDPVRILTAAAEGNGGPSYSLAAGRATSSRDAALLDGTSAHALDLDDMDEAYIAHPSAVLMPALWSVGQSVNSSGEELLSAFRVGVITNRVVAAHLDMTAHYGAGWHATSTIGTVGAAAAVCSLLKGTPDQARNTLGIAGSLAAGSRQNFGTMMKPMHAGFAAANATLSAHLGTRGFTSSQEQLTGPVGFLELFSGGSSRMTPNSEDLDRAFAPAGFNIKRFPCCYRTHPSIEAASELAGQVAPEDIASVTVTVQPAGLVPLIHHRPSEGAEAKFSIEYTVAAALLDGAVTFSSFDEPQVARPDVQALLRRVVAQETPIPPQGPPDWRESFAVVTVTTNDGRSLSARNDYPKGHTGAPLTEQQLRMKFAQCVGLEDQGVPDAIYERIRGLRTEASIRATMQLASQLELENMEEEPCLVVR